MISRRDFLKQSLAVVSLGVSVPTVFSKAVVASAEEKSDASVSGKTLVIVQLAGGIDGLNVLIPYKEGAYRSQRPSLAIPEQEMLIVNDRIAFHPSMGPLKELFDGGKMAVIEGVGYPNPDFSHFNSMDIWQSADPGRKAREGWLGRYFEGLTDAEGHPLAGLNVGRRLPAAFRSDTSIITSMDSLETYGLQPALNDANPEARQASLLRLYDVYKPRNASFWRAPGHNPRSGKPERCRPQGGACCLSVFGGVSGYIVGQRAAAAGGADRFRRRGGQDAAARWPRNDRRIRYSHAAARQSGAPADRDQ
ncbi:MAG: hypothetical protein GEU75_13760 [Dehalococcoidia bacterium]|nr:hypothetical protein [Dehalococcoidia bacterium]